MTSQVPSKHGVTLLLHHSVPALRPETSTLAELFRNGGYETAAFVNNSVAGEYLTKRGFDLYVEGQHRAPNITERVPDELDYHAPAVNKRVFEWLGRKRTQPFFLFILYFEPHSPYDPPPEHDLFKGGPYASETNSGYDRLTGRLFRLANLRDPAAIERLYQLYDGKIHFIDHHVGELLKNLRLSGRVDDTIVFLTSDHGELLYSHADDYMTFDHRSLYEPVMHIPGIVWGKSVAKGKTIPALATHIDVAPTLLEMAGLPPKKDAQGHSLVPLMTGKATRNEEYVFGEQDQVERLRSVRDTRWKLILNEDSGKKQLYDYVADPGERKELSSAQPEVVKRLSGVLERWRKENEPGESERLSRWREISAAAPKVHVTDEMTIGANMQLTGGGWRMDDNEKDWNGGAYWTKPAKAGEAARTATWRNDSPMLGRYRISLWYGALSGGGLASDASYLVKTWGGEKTIRIDQRQNAGKWQDLGVFQDPRWVTLTNKADGRIIVDAVKFEREE